MSTKTSYRSSLLPHLASLTQEHKVLTEKILKLFRDEAKRLLGERNILNPVFVLASGKDGMLNIADLVRDGKELRGFSVCRVTPEGDVWTTSWDPVPLSIGEDPIAWACNSLKVLMPIECSQEFQPAWLLPVLGALELGRYLEKRRR